MPVKPDHTALQPDRSAQAATKRQCWRWQLVYWLAYLLLKSFYLSQMLPLQGLPLAPAVLSYTLLTAISMLWSWLLLLPLLRAGTAVRPAAQRLLTGLLPLLLLLLPLRILLLQHGSDAVTSFHQWYHYLFSGLPQTLLPLAGWLAMMLLLLQQQQQQQTQQQQQHLQQQLLQARRALLDYQLDPHFMFNCLNALDALVVSRQATAAVTLTEQLAVFLRQACKAAEHWQGWPDELTTLQSYLAISQARFGERLQVHWQIIAQPATTLPALLLQPLAELLIEQLVAVSNGYYQLNISTARAQTAGWQITLQLQAQRGHTLRVLSAPAVITQLQQRLAQLYAGAASCHLQQTGSTCQICLTIPGATDEQANPRGAG